MTNMWTCFIDKSPLKILYGLFSDIMKPHEIYVCETWKIDKEKRAHILI